MSFPVNNEAITLQPVGFEGFGAPMPATDFTKPSPMGLECLATLDQVTILQEKHIAEVLLGVEWRKKYKIYNALNQQIYTATEDTYCCTRPNFRECTPAPGRMFEITVRDNNGAEVLRASRMEVVDNEENRILKAVMKVISLGAGDEVQLGYVDNQCALDGMWFVAYDSYHDELFSLTGPQNACPCCQEVEFEVTFRADMGKSSTAHIHKSFRGCIGCCADREDYYLSFQLNLDVKLKAILLASIFLVDVGYFEAYNRFR